jgi:hypothetical protein
MAGAQVENPVAFAEGATRALSLAHLHAQYAGLLLYPARMSADWSYRCVPLVQRLADPRNLGAAALYAGLAWLLLAGRPWQAAMHALYGPRQVSSLAPSCSHAFSTCVPCAWAAAGH